MPELKQVMKRHPEWPLNACLWASAFMKHGASLEDIDKVEKELLALCPGAR